VTLCRIWAPCDCSSSTSIQLALRSTDRTCRQHGSCALWSSVVYHCWSLQKRGEEHRRVRFLEISCTLTGFTWFDMIIGKSFTRLLQAYCRNVSLLEFSSSWWLQRRAKWESWLLVWKRVRNDPMVLNLCLSRIFVPRATFKQYK